jgi:hypothetical protein
MNYLDEDLGGCSMPMDELEAGWLQVSEVGEAGSKYERAWITLARILGGCSMRMDELEAGWLQVSEVGEAGSKYEREWITLTRILEAVPCEWMSWRLVGSR